MFYEIIRAFGIIFIAEMGDKSQILAMAFAAKYDIKKVLLGIFLGAFLNHAIAVSLGSLFSNIIPVDIISIIAGFAFILFALWSLKLNSDDDSVKKKAKYGPVITVALAFFIGELGDKTQLAAITLSASSQYPLYILIGTVSGMFVTGALAIYVGIKLGSKIPDFFMKLGAASMFFIFGFIKLYSNLPNEFNKLYITIPFTIIILILGYIIFKPSIELRKQGTLTKIQRTAKELHGYYHDISIRLEDICLGTDVCGVCSGSDCLVGYTKSIIRKSIKGEEIDLNYFEILNNEKIFDKDKIVESLVLTLNLLLEDPCKEDYIGIHQARNNFETILLGTYIKEFINFEEYIKKIEKLDKSLAKKLNR